MWWAIKKIQLKNVTEPGIAYKQMMVALKNIGDRENVSTNLWEVNICSTCNMPFDPELLILTLSRTVQQSVNEKQVFKN